MSNDSCKPTTRNISQFILPYKSKELSTSLRADLTSLNKGLDVYISPVSVSSKVRDLIKPSLTPVGPDKIVSQSKVVYNYRCSCDMGYIGYTNRHLDQRIKNMHVHLGALFSTALALAMSFGSLASK